MLLVSLAMLALLSMFTLTLVNITNLERQASSNYRLQAQARLLAEAGVQEAIAHAKNGIRVSPFATPDDWWINGTQWPLAGTPSALQPTIGVNAYGGQNRYEVRCWDLGSRLPINNQSPHMPTALEDLLETLTVDPTRAAAYATALIGARRLRSSKAVEEIFAITAVDLGSDRATGIADYLLARDFITVHDATRPVADHQDLSTANTDLPWAYTEPARGHGLVNINGASKEVLVAVLTELRGKPISLGGEAVAGGEWLDSGQQRSAAGAGTEISITAAQAGLIADEIIALRGSTTVTAGKPVPGPFRSWEQFHLFLDVTCTVDETIISADERGLIMTLCGPDGRNMGYNPDATRRWGNGDTLFDKACLTNWTALFTLGPSGLFEIRSRGFITDAESDPDSATYDAAAEVLAEDFIDRTVRLYSSVYWGSQKALESIWTNKTTVAVADTYQSMPEYTARADVGSDVADPLSGHLRLTTEWNALGGDANRGTNFNGTTAAGPYDPFAYFVGAGAQPDVKLREQGVFAPDGMIVWRKGFGAANMRLRLGALPQTFAQNGSAEFWVKLANDADSGVGTDEVLLALNINDGPGYPTADVESAVDGYTKTNKTGVTVKVERFGEKIRATWFYWGKNRPQPAKFAADGALSRFRNVLMENSETVTWKAGEWHHVMVNWNNTLQDWPAAVTGSPTPAPATDDIDLVIDQVPAGSKFPWPSLESGGEWFGLGDDNDFVSNGVDADGNGIADDVEANGVTIKGNVIFYMGDIASLPQEFLVYAGGMTVNPTAGAEVWDTGTMKGAELYRYPNATIDDVYLYDDPTGATGKAPANRYEANGAAPNFAQTLSFSLPVPEPAPTLPVRGRFEVACVYVNFEVPTTGACAARATLGGTSRNLPTPEKFAVFSNFTAAQRKAFHDAASVPLTVGLRGDGSATPVMENVTMYVIHPVELVEDDEEAPVGP